MALQNWLASDGSADPKAHADARNDSLVPNAYIAARDAVAWVRSLPNDAEVHIRDLPKAALLARLSATHLSNVVFR